MYIVRYVSKSANEIETQCSNYRVAIKYAKELFANGTYAIYCFKVNRQGQFERDIFERIYYDICYTDINGVRRVIYTSYWSFNKDDDESDFLVESLIDSGYKDVIKYKIPRESRFSYAKRCIQYKIMKRGFA